MTFSLCVPHSPFRLHTATAPHLRCVHHCCCHCTPPGRSAATSHTVCHYLELHHHGCRVCTLLHTVTYLPTALHGLRALFAATFACHTPPAATRRYHALHSLPTHHCYRSSAYHTPSCTCPLTRCGSRTHTPTHTHYHTRTTLRLFTGSLHGCSLYLSAFYHLHVPLRCVAFVSRSA